MKGKIGTSTHLVGGKQLARSFRKKCNKAKRRIKSMGDGVLHAKAPQGIVIVPPKKST